MTSNLHTYIQSRIEACDDKDASQIYEILCELKEFKANICRFSPSMANMDVYYTLQGFFEDVDCAVDDAIKIVDELHVEASEPAVRERVNYSDEEYVR